MFTCNKKCIKEKPFWPFKFGRTICAVVVAIEMAINFNRFAFFFFVPTVIDCTVSEWGVWSECDVSCGTGMMSRTRSILNAPENGGKHCPSLVQKRGCQGFKCHGQRDRRVLRGMYLLLSSLSSFLWGFFSHFGGFFSQLFVCWFMRVK